ncbi:hypothetical protein MPDQ_000906 [Monascus purpureus]|uniref:Dienelactone hydrolase domain-containing protein n=1 Tax=Monascus purpureus TaxID=5098 RepID=A0A507R4H2_MONPU|nr:hypothetical protein MPDQ_000906 [Monascus purpureus]BDD55628.1 hypothetical protein MAP00_001122 [Monascus purpureus]
MASNPPGQCCASGFKHEGTPVGEIKTVGGVNTYVTLPKGQKTEKAILFLPDVFGIYTNSQLLADEFAANGYATVLPDYFREDALKLEDMNSGKVDVPSWLKNHQAEQVEPIVGAALKYAKEELGAKKIGAVGYCFGAKYVVRWLKADKVDVGYVAHPSFVTHEELAAIQGPLSIAAAETDNIFTTQLRHESEDTLIKTGQRWQINLYSGVVHGFAVRTDLSDVYQKWAKEQAFCQAIQWFKNFL